MKTVALVCLTVFLFILASFVNGYLMDVTNGFSALVICGSWTLACAYGITKLIKYTITQAKGN